MKRISVLLMILFVSACGDEQAEQSEADSQEETASTEKQSNDELTELEKENEELRKELAEKEKEEAEENTASEADKAEDSEGEAASQNDNKKTAAVEEETAELAVQEFTMEEQQEMTQHFYDWAIERAEIGNMAVTNMYFSHGAAGHGDWYAMTPDGEVQTQNQDNPGFDHFDIHAVGGVAFYQPASGDFGEDADAPFPGTAEGYSRLALPDTNIHKYMLADNGVVYELIGKKENMSFSSGFGEYDDEGTYGEYPPRVEFEISGDQDAQQEWKRILGMYQR
ncbi:hypothetical protein [Jeotgalicoccus halotolerans]|uniref:Lipoprotein n=1 Tax=Jeotgalicoccus halotolerans TaxID=157227 RepID=A0A3E0B0N4_9STAP|nr:hypothetical protein [Jeotgalicoccus halotolerans]REG25540.1 hypothetical protein DFR63_0580 [Jeotgalicoccus halotolerans]